MRARRDWLAVLLIVFGSLLSGAYALLINPPKVLTHDDGALKWEERMQPVRAALPASVTEVGYISDNDPTAMMQEYSLTRFALAPVVVRQDVNHEWIIGNFTEPGFEELLKEKIPSRFTFTKMGGGIYLIHRSLP